MIIHHGELTNTWIDRLSEAGISALGIHPWSGKGTFETLENLLEMIQTTEYRSMIDRARSRGLEVEYEIHAAGYLMPRKLFREHPEYFRMNEKEERTDDLNFCVSNSAALDLAAKRAVELALALYGSSHNYHFWMDDGGHGQYCHCPKCKKLSPSDQQLLVVNRMAEEIRKHIPDAKIAYLAYHDTISPPTRITPAKGVFLEYAPFEKYTARGGDAAELIDRELKMIRPLMRFFDREPKKVLEYWYDNSLYSRWKKPPARFVLNEENMLKDIEAYRNMGFDSISTFACFLDKEYEKLYGEADIMPFARAVL